MKKKLAAITILLVLASISATGCWSGDTSGSMTGGGRTAKPVAEEPQKVWDPVKQEFRDK